MNLRRILSPEEAEPFVVSVLDALRNGSCGEFAPDDVDGEGAPPGPTSTTPEDAA